MSLNNKAHQQQQRGQFTAISTLENKGSRLIGQGAEPLNDVGKCHGDICSGKLASEQLLLVVEFLIITAAATFKVPLLWPSHPLGNQSRLFDEDDDDEDRGTAPTPPSLSLSLCHLFCSSYNSIWADDNLIPCFTSWLPLLSRLFIHSKRNTKMLKEQLFLFRFFCRLFSKR